MAAIIYSYLYSEYYETVSGERCVREGKALLRSYEQRNLPPAAGACHPG